MPDWEAHVRRGLAQLMLASNERDEVIEELASHLQESFEQLRAQGMTAADAEKRVLAQVSDWNKFRREIQIAKTKENSMSDRVKQFWLPSFLTLLVSMGLLALIQIFGPSPWIVARHDGSPWRLIAPVAVIYVPWLLCLPLVGAMGAFLSRRSGGSRRAILSSTLFPVLPYLGFFLIGLPTIAILNEHIAHNIKFVALFVGFFAWVLAPGVALLTGGLLAGHFFHGRPVRA
jgi:hypothetical protein